jgi:hypothetical protein
MEIENILNEIFDLSIKSTGTDYLDEIITLLNNLMTMIELIKDDNLKQWVSEYTGYWTNIDNLKSDIEAFRGETSELLVGVGNQNSLDLEM